MPEGGVIFTFCHIIISSGIGGVYRLLLFASPLFGTYILLYESTKDEENEGGISMLSLALVLFCPPHSIHAKLLKKRLHKS